MTVDQFLTRQFRRAIVHYEKEAFMAECKSSGQVIRPDDEMLYCDMHGLDSRDFNHKMANEHTAKVDKECAEYLADPVAWEQRIIDRWFSDSSYWYSDDKVDDIRTIEPRTAELANVIEVREHNLEKFKQQCRDRLLAKDTR